MEISLLNLLVMMAFGLLLAVTGGISYLTFAEWRDRRRFEQERRGKRQQRR